MIHITHLIWWLQIIARARMTYATFSLYCIFQMKRLLFLMSNAECAILRFNSICFHPRMENSSWIKTNEMKNPTPKFRTFVYYGTKTFLKGKNHHVAPLFSFPFCIKLLYSVFNALIILRFWLFVFFPFFHFEMKNLRWSGDWNMGMAIVLTLFIHIFRSLS